MILFLALTPFTQISPTKEPMGLRVQLKIEIKTDDDLAKTATENSLEDALAAEKMLWISKHTERESSQLQPWLNIDQPHEHTRNGCL